MNNHTNLLILSGPSGSGKSTLTKHLQENIPHMYFSISTTTRQKREGEIENLHYYFVSEEEFKLGIEQGQFLEWAIVHNNYYGTSKAPVEQALKEGKIVIFDIDVQGHRDIKKHYPNACSVFINTKDQETLKQRLISRGTDSKEIIQKRLVHAYNEMQCLKSFDYLIINENLEKSKEAILSIAKTLAYRQKAFNFEKVCQEWKAH
ncbi:guanylate kinase [Helicobacter cetorum]|uniref:Guanylate kinase n=1 Tax=Helicobacter cetorum (strain ATCC BAA-429 / MIT 00-7128) TaxID=182217 RepID=I0ENG4_HELC0|nr:guanylate kinase [Helicobacter cetorum]AFI04483.1 guanylate kinase [Helicobacter cetorum MIT 00-7128]